MHSTRQEGWLIATMEDYPRGSKTKDSPFNQYEIRHLIEKIIKIIVIESFMYGAFILFDPGFLDSLVVYFSLIIVASIIVVTIFHVRDVKEDQKDRVTSVLDQTDYAGEY